MNPVAETNEAVDALPVFQPPATLGDVWNSNFAAAGLSAPVGVQQPRREAVNDLLDAYQRASGRSVFDAASDAGMPISSWAYTNGKLNGMLTSNEQAELTGVASTLASRLPDDQAKQVQPFLDVDANAAAKAQQLDAQASEVNARAYGLTATGTSYVAGLARGLVDPTSVAGVMVGAPEAGAVLPMLGREFAVNAGFGAATHEVTAPERARFGLPEGSLLEDALTAGAFGAGLSGVLRGAGWAMKRAIGGSPEAAAGAVGDAPPPGFAPNPKPDPDIHAAASELAPEDFEAAARFQDRETAIDALAPVQTFEGRAHARDAVEAAAAHIETGDMGALGASTIDAERPAPAPTSSEAGAASMDAAPVERDPTAIAADTRAALQQGSIDPLRFSSAPTSEQLDAILGQRRGLEDEQADRVFGPDAEEAKRLMRSNSSAAGDKLDDLVEKYGRDAEGVVYGMHGFPIIDKEGLESLRERISNVEFAVQDAAKGDMTPLAQELAWIAPKLPDVDLPDGKHTSQQREAVLAMARAMSEMEAKGVDSGEAFKLAIKYSLHRVNGDADDARVLMQRMGDFARRYGPQAEPPFGGVGAPAQPLALTAPAKPAFKAPAAGAAPQRPQSLLSFLTEQGGVKNQGGELSDLVRRYPGLVNNKRGLSLDEARLRAAERGYFGADTESAMANTTPAHLLEMLPNAHERFSARDFAELDAYEQYGKQKAYAQRIGDLAANIDHEAERLGLGAQDPELSWTAAELMHAEGLSMDEALDRAATMLYERDVELRGGREGDNVTEGEGGAEARAGDAGEGDRSGGQGAVDATRPEVREPGEAGGGAGGIGGSGQDAEGGKAAGQVSDPGLAAQRADVERALAEAGDDVKIQNADGSTISAREALSAVDEFKAATRELAGCILKFGE